MIIKFVIENWMSFFEPGTLSMVASRERQHKERVPYLEKYQFGVLPVAAIYGGNASGKTNLFKALSFAKNLVVKGSQPESVLPLDFFKLDLRAAQMPAKFIFELLIDDTIYEFSFSLTRKAIVEEKLVEVSSASEKILYHRKDNKPNFDKSLDKVEFLKFAFQGTRDNQLFLTNSVSQKVENFKPVYDWFRYNLELIAPDSRFEQFEHFLDEDHPLYSTMNATLPLLDTGISHLGGEEISFANMNIPEQLKIKLQEEVKEGATVKLFTENFKERFLVTRKNGELIAKKVFTYHPMENGNEAQFEMSQESDGSQRIIDLLPAFLDISSPLSKKVYVIDEVDRSLHTLLTRKIIEKYLSSCSPSSRAQLLFTTHDVLLMDQNLFRRDEMWIAERNNNSSSKLLSFSDYKEVRSDKDIRKSYLQGRLGGIPRILLGNGISANTQKKIGDI